MGLPPGSGSWVRQNMIPRGADGWVVQLSGPGVISMHQDPETQNIGFQGVEKTAFRRPGMTTKRSYNCPATGDHFKA